MRTLNYPTFEPDEVPKSFVQMTSETTSDEVAHHADGTCAGFTLDLLYKAHKSQGAMVVEVSTNNFRIYVPRASAQRQKYRDLCKTRDVSQPKRAA
jgi:hypothetical protein